MLENGGDNYDGVVMTVVNGYKYLVIYFTTRLFCFCL